MLNINSISNGIVIDHIQCGKGYQIFQLLGLDEADYTVALIMNARSEKLGRKDMIKIENVLDIDLDILGVFDEQLTINLIEDEEIIEKRELHLPKHIEGFLTCNNPRCITSQERNITQRFEQVDEESRLYKCIYCEHLYEVNQNAHAN